MGKKAKTTAAVGAVTEKVRRKGEPPSRNNGKTTGGYTQAALARRADKRKGA